MFSVRRSIIGSCAPVVKVACNPLCYSLAVREKTPFARMRPLALAGLICLAGAAVAQDPGEAPYDYALGKILLEEGEWTAAGESLLRAIEAVPDDPYLRVEYAGFLLNAGEVDAVTEQLDAARELGSSDIYVLKAIGQLQLQAARDDERYFAQARSAFEGLRESAPGDLEAMSTLGRIYLSERRFADAARVFEEALAYHPQARSLHGSLIDALLRAGETTQAERAIEGFLAVAPDSIRARMTLADLRQKRDDAAGAAEVLGATPHESVGDSAMYRDLAGALYDFGLYPEALFWLDRSLQVLEPGVVEEPQALFLRSLLLTSEGRDDEARADLERLVDIAPERLDALKFLVRHLFNIGEWQAAADRLEPRLDGDLDLPKAELAMLYARALRNLDRQEESLDWLARAAGKAELRDRALAQQAETLLGLERDEEADLVLAELVDRGGQEALLMAAEACQREERYARSVPLLEQVVAEDEGQLQALFWLGAAYERTGRPHEAESQFRRFLEQQPDSAPALNYLGYMWADNGTNLSEALEFVERAVALDPDNGAYVDSLGWAHYRLGNFEEAREHLERAAGLVGDDAVVLEHLADVYSELGQREEAVGLYRRALALGGENASSVEAKLQQLGSP